MLKVLIIATLALASVACSTNNCKNSVWGEWNPSFEVDDIRDGVFPNKSTRTGERAYIPRIRGGMKHKLNKRGLKFKLGAGMRNRHIVEGIFEIEKDL